MLARAAHRSKRQIEELVAELAPRPEVPASIRKLPEPRASQLRPDGVGAAPEPSSNTIAVGGEPAPAAPQERSNRRADVLEPIARARYRVQFTASGDPAGQAERLQALIPGADLPALIEPAVTEKLERLEARRFGSTRAPRKALAEAETSPGRRYIPAPVRRAVHERDGGRCAFVDARGRRCNERRQLEFHHRHPHGYGGDRSLDSISLQCKPHNIHLAEIDFGKAAIERHRRESR